MRKIEREPNGAGIFKPGQDLVVAGTVGKNGVKAALSAKEKEISARFPEWFQEHSLPYSPSYFFNFGSRASRRPSPIRFSASTVIMIASPGNNVI